MEVQKKIFPTKATGLGVTVIGIVDDGKMRVNNIKKKIVCLSL